MHKCACFATMGDLPDAVTSARSDRRTGLRFISLRRPLLPNTRPSRAGIRFMPQARRASVCGSAAGYVLRSPNHRPKPDNPQTRAKCRIGQSVIGLFGFSNR